MTSALAVARTALTACASTAAAQHSRAKNWVVDTSIVRPLMPGVWPPPLPWLSDNSMTDEEREEQLNQILANAKLVVAELSSISGVEAFGLNRTSLVWVEGYIDRQREHGGHDATAISNLVSVFGSYLGECLIAAAGGSWHCEPQQGWSVRFPNDSHAFPFVKVRKVFDDGLSGGQSVVSFYDIAVNYVATGRLENATSSPPQAPLK